jgi:hypothetical protein
VALHELAGEEARHATDDDAEEREEMMLLPRLGRVVDRPVLLVGDPLRHLDRPRDRLGPVGLGLAGQDELHGEHVLALDAPVPVVGAGAVGDGGGRVDLVRRPVPLLRRDDPLSAHLLDPIEGRECQAALLTSIHANAFPGWGGSRRMELLDAIPALTRLSESDPRSTVDTS